MTCKDCKSRHTCTEPNKSYEYDKDGDSWANWCDDFDVALNRVRYGKDTEMTTEEYEKFIKDCNTEVKK